MRAPREIVVTGVAVVVVAAGFIGGIVVPAEKRLEDKRQRCAHLQTEIAREQTVVESLRPVWQEYMELCERLADLTTRIPADKELSDAFARITDMIREAGLSRPAIQPARRYPAAEGVVDAPPGADRIVVQAVMVQFEGPMPSVFQFLGALEHWKRVARVERMRIVAIRRGARSEGGGGSSDRTPVVRCDLVLSLYYGSRPGAAPTPDEKPAAPSTSLAVPQPAAEPVAMQREN